MGSSKKKKQHQQQQQDDALYRDESAAAQSSAAVGSNAETSSYASLPFTDVLEDLSSRFIVNLPAEELVSIERICFQVEQAHWFYEDFLRPLNPSLPSLALRKFSSYLLHSSALTLPIIQRYISSAKPGQSGSHLSIRQQQEQQGLDAAFEEFLKYKTRVPVCGAVILNRTLDKCLLVKGWKSSAAWGFPKGKINKGEPERDCAVREVFEETGFDCGPHIPADSQDYMELTMREQKIRLYIVPRIDEETQFETMTRKEISKIAWFKLSDLPTWKEKKAPSQSMGGKFYLISPFIGKLKAWIKRHRGQLSTAAHYDSDDQHVPYTEDTNEEAQLYDLQGSDSLKAILGLGTDSGQAAVPQQPLQQIPEDSQGMKMIQEQGDARGRQLLDLLRGGQSAGLLAQQQSSTSLEDGEQALLSALNMGSGSSVPTTHDPFYQHQHQRDYPLSNGHSQGNANDYAYSAPQVGTPLPAPQAQRVNQAESLLNLISHSHVANPPAPTDHAERIHGHQGFLPFPPPNETLAFVSGIQEQERVRQREKLLSNLMSSALSFDEHSQGPPRGDVQLRAHPSAQHISQSPATGQSNPSFSNHQSLSPTNGPTQANDLLTMLNASPYQSAPSPQNRNGPQQNISTANDLLAMLSGPGETTKGLPAQDQMHTMHSLPNEQASSQWRPQHSPASSNLKTSLLSLLNTDSTNGPHREDFSSPSGSLPASFTQFSQQGSANQLSTQQQHNASLLQQLSPSFQGQGQMASHPRASHPHGNSAMSPETSSRAAQDAMAQLSRLLPSTS